MRVSAWLALVAITGHIGLLAVLSRTLRADMAKAGAATHEPR